MSIRYDYAIDIGIRPGVFGFCIPETPTERAAREAKQAAEAKLKRECRGRAADLVLGAASAHPIVKQWVDTGSYATYANIPNPCDFGGLERVARALFAHKHTEEALTKQVADMRKGESEACAKVAEALRDAADEVESIAQ
jgi:hypothetical protein